MGKGKRARDTGTRRRTILQIDSNKISRSSNVRATPVEAAAPVPPAADPVDDQVAKFLREISALEKEQETAKNNETEPSTHPSTDLTLPTNSTETAQQSTGTALQLPEGWEQIFDANSGFHYFWNVHTNETRWDPPTQNPVGLSLISSAYSESDSDSPVSNQPRATATEEGAKKREIIVENKPKPEDSRDNLIQAPYVDTTEHKLENTICQQPSLIYANNSDSEGNFDSLKPRAKRVKETPRPPPPIHASTQTEEVAEKPTEDALRPLIQQLATEITHKLDFLGISAQQLNQLQAMMAQVETRVSDWRSGHLPSEYTLSRLQESARMLREYEQSAAPVGWGCTWDPSSQRYQYVQVSSGVTMWEYPVTAASTEVLGGEDMVLSGGESDEHPPLPPLPPSPTSGPPPPPSSYQSSETNPPLPNSPPLPLPLPTETPVPPPLPSLKESTPPAAPPPLPPAIQHDLSSPPLPPCPEVGTPPLPPSDTSSHMSQSPSTKPNSPYPPSDPDIPNEPINTETAYSTSHYDTTQYYVQQDQQLVYAYYTPNAAGYESYAPASYPMQTNTPAPIERQTSPVSKVRGKSKKAQNPSSLATHAVSVKKKGMANMLEKWQQLSALDTPSDDSESETEEENSLKHRIEEWKKEQVVSGRAKENANFDNIRGNWKEKIQRAKRTQQGETSLLISKQTEG